MSLVRQRIKAIIREVFAKASGSLFKCIVAPAGEEISGQYESVHLPVKFNRCIPEFLDSLHYKFYSGAKGITAESEMTFVKHINAARVFSSSGVVISKKNRIVLTTTKEDSSNEFFLVNFFICKVKVAKGKSLIIAARHADSNYFHWMTESLPKIFIAEKARYTLSEIDSVIVSDDLQLYQKETLDHLEITNGKRLSLSTYPLIYCNELIMPSATCLSGNVPGWIIDFLRERFREWMQYDPSFSAKIYVGRKKEGKRVLLNEEVIKNKLSEFGYQNVYLEDLSVKQQVRLFFNAREIIGIHGAGLTNIIFSQVGCFFTELFPPTYVNQCYWTIASYNKLKYSYLLGEGDDITNNEKHLIDSDFLISVDKLVELINKITNKS